jgi:hypothetical protein
MTAYKIYRRICNELGILFPLQEKELSVPVNQWINSLEFYPRHKGRIVTYDEKRHMSDVKNSIASAYYKICRDIGVEKVHDMTDEVATFSLHASEYPDRKISLHTVLSILYLSGYRDMDLVSKGKNYLVTAEKGGNSNEF